MRGAVLLPMLAAALAAQQAGVEGIVVDQTSGQRLARVHVRVTPDADPDSAEEIYGAASDNAGHFAIARLNPGRYQVLLERAGYVQTPAKGAYPIPRFTLKAGQNLTDLKLEMARRALLSGRVVDEYGDPMPRLQVLVIPVAPTRLPPSLLGGLNMETDDRGEFQFLTGPGKYCLLAEPFRLGLGRTPERRSDGTSEATYFPTYYPNATTQDRASVVEVAAGREAEGIEIHMTTAPAQRLLTVSGTVRGIPPGAFAFVLLLSTDSSQPMRRQFPAEVDQQGRFSISGLLPGPYDLVARCEAKAPLRGRTSLKLGSDVSDLELVLRPPGEVTGTVVVGQAMADGSPAVIRTVSLEPAGGYTQYESSFPSTTVERDGSFRIDGVWPGKFRLLVDPLPDTAYIQSVEVDGAAAHGGVIELKDGANAPRVKITVNLNGAVLSGRVLDMDGELDTSPLARVFLLADAKEIPAAYGTLLEGGKYTVKGIRPGKYRLFACDATQLACGFDANERQSTLRKLFSMAEEMEIRPGDRIVKDLKVGVDADGKQR